MLYYFFTQIAPMRFFYRVAQEEQKLEAPLHQRPSTPGLGARDCLPPNEAPNDNNLENNPHLETSRLEIKSASDSVETISAKDLNKIDNEIIPPVDRKQTTTVEKDEANKITMMTVSTTSSTLTTTNATRMLTTTAMNASPSSGTSTSLSTTCNDSNKQMKSPIKILKNSDGRYEVLKSSPAAAVTDVKNLTNPEFSVVNSNGVKITLKQCSPPQSSSMKKPKVISNVLLRCGQVEKDASQPSGAFMIQLQQQQNKDKLTTTSPILPGKQEKQEKQRRKVTFVDRSPTSGKASPTTSIIMPKTALKKPAEQQDKKQFLQGFQLTAREPSMSDDNKLKSPVRDINVAMSTVKSLQKNNVIPKMEESSKKDTNEVKKKNNIENTGSNANNSITATNKTAKRVGGIPANPRTYTHKIDDADERACNSGTSTNSLNIASSNHAAKTDVYTFSSDPPIVPAGAVKRKCPPGVPIADLKRRKTSQVMQRQETNKRQNVSSYNSVVNKLPRTSSMEHVVPTSRMINMMTDHDAGSNRVSNVNNTKATTGPLLSNDTRDLLVDGYGLNIPASLSITLTSPKSPGSTGQLVEPNDPSDNNRKAVLGKVNPSITLNDRSVDPRVLKALKTGQIKMPTTPPKAKTIAAAITTVTTDRGEAINQQRTMTLAAKRKREHESSRDILDLSGGNKKMDIHPLRIPQPVTKLNKTNKVTTDRDNMQPGGISDQGQVVTLMGGHRYYRAPPGSLTPAAHRVNDCPLPPSPSRTPVYAPSFGINRSNSDLSSVFPSLPSLYALHQAPNLQQFQMDAARLRLPPRSTENGATSATGNSDSTNSNISGIPGKSHLAAQCAPVKPARSSVASLAVPINKQQPIEKSTNISVNRTVPVDSNKPLTFRNNEAFKSTDETSHVQRRYSLNVESTNNSFLSRSECAKNNDQAINEIIKDSNTEPETINTDNSVQQQEQQHREATSPNIVSSTASPSPPPGNAGINTRNEDNANNSGTNINSNDSNGSNNVMPDQIKNTNSEVTCSKSPDSPDSSSITVENSGTSKNTTLTDREMPTDVQTSSDTAKTSESESVVNPDNSIIDDSTTIDDKNKFANKSEANEIAKQLCNSVQESLLAVFPSVKWANNPVAAEHLGNFLKSLNATINGEGRFAEGSKAEKIDQKTTGNDDNENR